MKKLIAVLFLVTLAFNLSIAQSKSFLTLKDTFGGEKDVYSFKASGGLARLALRIAGEDEWQDAISEVQNVRFIVVPKEAFRERKLTVNGFRKLAKSHGFEELARIQNHGDDVHILLQAGKNDNNNRYLVLVNEPDEFIAFEIKGYINPEKIRKEIASNNR